MSWPSTESSLIRKIRDWRNEKAWTAFVDLYAPFLYRLCRRQRLQDADAADVVQNVLARVSRASQSYNQERGRFRTWLITITSREIHRYKERGGGVPTGAAGDVAQQEIEAELAASWAVEYQVQLFDCAMERVRGEFDDLAWRAFQLVWIEKMKAQEAAARCGKSVPWVYRTKQQVLQRLRKEVEALEADSALSSGEEEEA